MSRRFAHLVVIAVVVGLVSLAFARVNYAWNWAGVWEYRAKFLHGWLTTVGLSLASLVVSTLIGGIAAVCLQSKTPLVEAVGRVYVELIRGTPLLVQLLIGFYVVANAVGLENRYVCGVLVLSLFSGATWRRSFAAAWPRSPPPSGTPPGRSVSHPGSRCGS